MKQLIGPDSICSSPDRSCPRRLDPEIYVNKDIPENFFDCVCFEFGRPGIRDDPDFNTNNVNEVDLSPSDFKNHGALPPYNLIISQARKP
jgi:hypothetical protein